MNINDFAPWLPKRRVYRAAALFCGAFEMALEVYSRRLRKKEWGNCCVHCQALQEEGDDWRYDFRNPFSPVSVEEAMEMRIIYFKLSFDYYIRGGHQCGGLFAEMMR